MRGFVAAAQGRRSNEGRTDERHFVDAIATLLATTDGDEDEDMWQFANNGPLYWTKRDCSPLVPQSPRFFFPSFFRLPRQIFLAFPSLACIVPFLSVSPEGIVLASIPASSFPPSLASPRTTDPFPCKLYVKWRTFIPAARTRRNTPYKTREHPSPLPHVHTALMGVKREFWLAGCSSVPLPPLTDRLGEAEERGDGGH